MLLRQMRYFVTVIECNSFTEAAEACYISQSAISQQIRLLEEELGVELIHRENRKFSLTPAGEHFYRHSLIILDETERLKRETIQIGCYDKEHLKIGYPKCYGGDELHRAVDTFSEQYPDVALDIVNGNHEELYDLIRFGEVDLVLNDQRRAFSDEYVNHHLVTSNCYIEISKRSPLSSLEYVAWDELRKIPCILVASKEQQSIEKDFYQNTLGFGGSFLFAENMEEGRLMVIGNKGFMSIEGVPKQQVSIDSTIRRLPLYRKGQQITRNYCAFWKKEHSRDYVEKFADILREMF